MKTQFNVQVQRVNNGFPINTNGDDPANNARLVAVDEAQAASLIHAAVDDAFRKEDKAPKKPQQ